MDMVKQVLTLRGYYAGKTILLASVQFTKGKVTLCGSKQEVDSLGQYLRKCFQAIPEGEQCEMEEIENGSSTVDENDGNRPSNEVQSPVQPNGAGSSEKEPDNGKGTITDTDTSPRDSAGGSGFDDPRINTENDGENHEKEPTVDPKPVDPKPEDIDAPEDTPVAGFDGTAHSMLDPEKILKAMKELDPNNPEQWTIPGKPRVDAVEKLCGSAGLTRRDLDAVWPELVREPVVGASDSV